MAAELGVYGAVQRAVVIRVRERHLHALQYLGAHARPQSGVARFLEDLAQGNHFPTRKEMMTAMKETAAQTDTKLLEGLTEVLLRQMCWSKRHSKTNSAPVQERKREKESMVSFFLGEVSSFTVFQARLSSCLGPIYRFPHPSALINYLLLPPSSSSRLPGDCAPGWGSRSAARTC